MMQFWFCFHLINYLDSFGSINAVNLASLLYVAC